MSERIPAMPFVNHQFDGNKMVSDLCSVPDAAALQVAEFFEDAAKKLRERHAIYQRQQSLKRESEAHISKLHRLPGNVLDYMLAGHSFEVAARMVSDQHQIPRETVYRYWLGAIAQIEAKSKAERNMSIVAMYESECTDKEIADKVGLSERQVRRVIQTHRNFP